MESKLKNKIYSPSLVFPQKRACLPGTKDKNGTTYNKTKEISSHQCWEREPNRRKGVSRAGKTITDTLTHTTRSNKKINSITIIHMQSILDKWLQGLWLMIHYPWILISWIYRLCSLGVLDSSGSHNFSPFSSLRFPELWGKGTDEDLQSAFSLLLIFNCGSPQMFSHPLAEDASLMMIWIVASLWV